ncbi:EF-hand domain-containing protein [Aurantimonas marianensis]|uniref:EF-hand domain-containing protein n=1 Tax=Aurantimonas marianensis TaxID=2920428 RepID=A0A9X2KFP0_9HYPH|nr:EF-hand domain-containing protein [Aurantimonas marianensis]MCP3055435.1 EF-hand domain-containing protein [Aurantimonas marianensis]
MIKSILTLATSALILAGSAMAANGQQTEGAAGQQDRPGEMMQQRDDDMMRPGRQRSERARDDDDMMRSGRQRSERDDDDDDRWGMPGQFYGQGGPDWRRGGMMGPRMGGPHMMRMMMILLDTNGDGALSLDEVQAVHARFFKAIDADADGKVTIEEMQGFMSPMGGRAMPRR